MRENLNDVQVGDKIIKHHSRHSPQVVEVTRLTEKQIVVGSQKFWKKNGDMVGGSSAWSSTWVVLASDEDIKMVAFRNAKRKLANKVSELAHVKNFHSLSLEELKTIMDILENETVAK